MPNAHRPESPLPSYLTRFVGRRAELAELSQLLVRARGRDAGTLSGPPTKHRLITLCGVGGSGKTRLALALAHSTVENPAVSEVSPADGMHWASLAPVTSARQVPPAVAAGFGAGAARSVAPTESIARQIGGSRALLVLDNCEHVLTACQQLVTRLLGECPQLVIVTTSRVPLGVPDEYVFAVPPMGMTSTASVEDEATALFLDRAAIVAAPQACAPAALRTIGDICRRLDGLPLAIELAASWLRVLSTDDLLVEIDRGLSFLSSTSPGLAERHRSMQAVLASSWLRLSEHDRQVLGALSVFSGSFSRDAAEVVGQADLAALSSLAEKALIARLPDFDQTRFHMHELIRQYAQSRSDAGTDLYRAKQRHLHYFVSLVEQAEKAWDSVHEQSWLDRLRVDHANIDAALRYALDSAEAEQALRLSAGLFAFWIYSAPPETYRTLLEQALSLPWADTSDDLACARARALNVAGYAATGAGDYLRARGLFDEALDLSSALGDRASVAWTLRGRSLAHRQAGHAELAQDDEEGSLAICRAINDVPGLAWCTYDLGEIAFARGDLHRGRDLVCQGLQLFEQQGLAFGAYRAVTLLGDIAVRHEQWLSALTWYEEALARQRRGHFVARGADILEGLAEIAVALQHVQVGARLLAAGDGWRRTFGVVRDAPHLPHHERFLQQLRRQIPAEVWAVHYDAGSRLTPDQAVDEAEQRTAELAARATLHGSGLTDRELEVLHALALGLTNAEIAAQLVVSTRTVHAHLRSIFAKLGVTTRTAAAHQAAAMHLIPTSLAGSRS